MNFKYFLINLICLWFGFLTSLLLQMNIAAFRSISHLKYLWIGFWIHQTESLKLNINPFSFFWLKKYFKYEERRTLKNFLEYFIFDNIFCPQQKLI